MGANRGHQLGLRLWQAPLPRRLHSSGCCARLDRPEHPGVTAPWPMARAWTGSTAAGHPTHAGELVAGKHGSAMGSSCDCVYCPNKESLLLLAQYLCRSHGSPGAGHGSNSAPLVLLFLGESLMYQSSCLHTTHPQVLGRQVYTTLGFIQS